MPTAPSRSLTASAPSPRARLRPRPSSASTRTSRCSASRSSRKRTRRAGRLWGMTTYIAPATHLPFELGEPRSFGSLTRVPLFPSTPPALEYIGLDEAIARGLMVTEVDEAGDVNSLRVANPLDELVLLYEGEELVGAKQNRIVTWTTLVPAKTTLPIRVDCVERGRWAFRTSSFEAAPRAAYPEVRRAKHHGGGQAAVWASVAAKAERLEVFSPTQAQEAIYVKRGSTLDEYVGALPRLHGQSGAIVGIAGEVVCLDYVGRSDVFAGIYTKLLRGYALDAIERPVEKPLAAGAVRRFLAGIDRKAAKLGTPVGVGTVMLFPAGAELSAYGEVVALSLHAS